TATLLRRFQASSMAMRSVLRQAGLNTPGGGTVIRSTGPSRAERTARGPPPLRANFRVKGRRERQGVKRFPELLTPHPPHFTARSLSRRSSSHAPYPAGLAP